MWQIVTCISFPSFFFWCLLSGWGWGGGGPASEPVLAWVQPQAPHLPLNYTHRPPPVANAAWRQETGTNVIGFVRISLESQLNKIEYWLSLLLRLSVVKEVLSHHLPGCHLLDCMLLLPDGVVGSPGKQFSNARSLLRTWHCKNNWVSCGLWQHSQITIKS